MTDGEKNISPARCPFCGERTVNAKVLYTMSFLSEHKVFENGVEPDGESMGQIFGEAVGDALRTTSFFCTSCGKKFFPHEYEFVKNASDGNSFVKKSGKKAR